MNEAIEICPSTSMSKIKAGALIVDVRELNEVEELAYDVPNILTIPITEFETRFKEIPKDREVIMVCKSGDRSLRTTYFLMNNDYPNVSNMSGGIVKWVDKGFPTIGNIESITEKAQSGSCCGTDSNNSGESCC